MPHVLINDSAAAAAITSASAYSTCAFPRLPLCTFLVFASSGLAPIQRHLSLPLSPLQRLEFKTFQTNWRRFQQRVTKCNANRRQLPLPIPPLFLLLLLFLPRLSLSSWTMQRHTQHVRQQQQQQVPFFNLCQNAAPATLTTSFGSTERERDVAYEREGRRRVG